MATRNLVPRATSEGSLGTDLKLWNELNVNKAYASNNVLVFNTVADMKASNKVKAGYTLKTLGYYSPNDGGGAEYVIAADIGNEQPDDGSIIALQKNLYAKLLITDYVNVKWFGAYGDGEHDDTVAIQNALNYVRKATKTFTLDLNINYSGKTFSEVLTLYIPKEVYLISDTLIIDVDCTNIKSDGACLVYTGNSSLLGLVSSFTQGSGNPMAQFCRRIEGLMLISTLDYRTSEAIGIDFGYEKEGVTTQTSNISVRNCAIYNFNKGTRVKNDDYNLMFNRVDFKLCSYGAIVGEDYTNSGEGIAFINCLFDGCKVALQGNNDAVHFHLSQCSIDYVERAFVLTKGAVAFVDACHFEWDISNDHELFNLSGNNTLLVIDKSFFLGQGGGTFTHNNPSIQSFIQITEPIKGILLNNCEFGRIHYTRFCTGKSLTLNNPLIHSYQDVPKVFSGYNTDLSSNTQTNAMLVNSIITDNLKVSADDSTGTLKLQKTDNDSNCNIVFYYPIKNNFRLPFSISIRFNQSISDVNLIHQLGYVLEYGNYNAKYKNFRAVKTGTTVNISSTCNTNLNNFNRIYSGTDFAKEIKYGTADTMYTALVLTLADMKTNDIILISGLDIGANYA